MAGVHSVMATTAGARGAQRSPRTPAVADRPVEQLADRGAHPPRRCVPIEFRGERLPHEQPQPVVAFGLDAQPVGFNQDGCRADFWCVERWKGEQNM